MPAIAHILLDGNDTPGSPYKIGDLVSLANFDDTDVTEWLWQLEASPGGSAAALLTDVTGSTNSFYVDLEGSYRVSLRVNGGPKDLAVARILTQNIHLVAHAKNETSEGDVPGGEGWAKPWRESNLIVDKAIGLSERRTVVYVSEFGTNTGPRVLEAYDHTTLPNGDVVPVVQEAQAWGGTPPLYAGHGLYLYDDTDTPLENNKQYSVLVKGLSKAIPAAFDPSTAGGGSGLQNFNFGGTSKNQNLFLGSYDGIIYNENDTGFYTSYGDHQVYLGYAINPQFDEDIYIWWNPDTGVPADTHGFLSGDGDNIVSGRLYHAVSDGFQAGFMSIEDKIQHDWLGTENILDNSWFDFWQRGSGSYGLGHFPLSESIAYNDFVSMPSRSYTADRWYATARNNDALSASVHDVSGTWSQALADTFNSTDHPYCMRVTNQSQNVAASGSFYTTGVGLQYYLVQEFDLDTIREKIILKDHSVRVRLRGGTEMGQYTSIWAGIVATNEPDPGPLTKYFNTAPYVSIYNFLSIGYLIAGTDWQDFETYINGFSGLFQPDITAAAFVLFSEMPSGSEFTNGFGTVNDYWEVSKIMLVTSSDGPSDYRRKGGSYDVDYANCRKWYEKSYPLDVKPGTPNAPGALRGMVTLAGEHVVPDVRFTQPKLPVTGGLHSYSTNIPTQSVRQIALYDSISGSSGKVFVSGSGLVSGSVFLTSSVGFSVHLSASQTFGREVQFHYTASVDI